MVCDLTVSGTGSAIGAGMLADAWPSFWMCMAVADARQAFMCQIQGAPSQLPSNPPPQIAADNAVFGQSGPKVGSFDAGYGSTHMARIIGERD